MAFEVFTEARARSSEFISINESQSFGFSRAFLDANSVTKNHRAVIMFDEEAKKIALQFTTEKVKHGFSVQINNEKHGGIVKAKSFFDRKGIEATKYSRRYPNFEKVDIRALGIDQDGIAFVITLEEVSTASNSEGDISRTAADMFRG